MSTFRVSLYIPSSLPESGAAIDRAMAGMSTLAGGATYQDMTGAWTMADGQICTEPIARVYTLTDDEMFPAVRAYAIGQARALKQALAQESVLVTVDTVNEALFL